MPLPDYNPSNVDLTPDEHLGVEPMYHAIQTGQKAIADGFDLEDLISVPGMAMDAGRTVQWILKGDPGDPTDDDAIADRMVAVGFGLVRASQVLKKKGNPE